jgi:adenylosuccinate synthase
MPKELGLFEKCHPVYEEFDGWNESTLGINEFSKLPRQAQTYIKSIEDLLGTKADIISTGQKRDELIVLKEQF